MRNKNSKIRKQNRETTTTTTENNAKLSPLLHTCKSIAIVVNELAGTIHPPPTHTHTLILAQVQPAPSPKRRRERARASAKCHPSVTRKFAAQCKCYASSSSNNKRNNKKLHLIFARKVTVNWQHNNKAANTSLHVQIGFHNFGYRRSAENGFRRQISHQKVTKKTNTLRW